MSCSTARRLALLMVAITVLASACISASPPGSVGSSPTGSAPGSQESTTTPFVNPLPSATASSSANEPPAASLAVEGGEPVTGQLGTFTWGDGGSDSPWLPGAPVAVGEGERMTVSLAEPVGVATWSAKRMPASTTGGPGAIGLGTGGPPISFDAPPPGSWSVQVIVDYADGLGSGTYYWLVTVR
jgi:hypothetical protein